MTVIVSKLALDDLLGFDRSKLECDIEPYSPCMMVVLIISILFIVVSRG